MSARTDCRNCGADVAAGVEYCEACLRRLPLDAEDLCAAPTAPQQISRFSLLKTLGRGGMGEVHLAHDRDLDRKVALKFIGDQLFDDGVLRKRFLREARAAAAVDHPYICKVYEVGQLGGRDFIAMEYVEGETLAGRLKRLERQPLHLKDVLRFAAEILEAMAFAHARGIVHRDLKPANVMLTADGHVKLMDFGLAKRVEPAAGRDVDPDGPTITRLTAAGAVLGTLPYMSPEQLRGEAVDARSDLFSFGVILYEMLTGKHPFHRARPAETAAAVLTEQPPPLRRSGVRAPASLQTMLDGALAKEVDRRAASAEVLRKRLGDVRSRLEPSLWNLLRKPVAALSLVGLLLAIVSVIAWTQWKAREERRTRATLPRIEQLARSGDYVEAYRLAVEAEAVLGSDPVIEEWMPEISDFLTIETEPAGARVMLKRFNPTAEEPPRPFSIGTTPIRDLRIERADYYATIEKEEFAPLERVLSSRLYRPYAKGGIVPPIHLEEKLLPADQVPSGMVFVPGGAYQLVAWQPVPGSVMLDDFFLDRYEVSNRDYAEFIRAGGYRDDANWSRPILGDDGRELSFAGAVALLVDRTGLPGPRDWVGQEYPEGKASHPVTGVTWFEAAAYCASVGKALPTIYQWEKAARAGRVSILAGFVMPWGLQVPGEPHDGRANLMGRGSEPVDRYEFGISPYGAYNMAGNVEEWLLNESAGGFAAAGASWTDPAYVFSYTTSSRSGFVAAPTLGFRCVSRTPEGGNDPGTGPLSELAEVVNLEPVDDPTFASFLTLYRYDEEPLEPETLETVETPDWVREKISFRGIDDRILAYLYLPKRAVPPYQMIYYGATVQPLLGDAITKEIEGFLFPQIKAGRALMALVPKYAFERPAGLRCTGLKAPLLGGLEKVSCRDELALWVQEYRIGLDYIGTRDDIDAARIGYLGISWGAGPVAILFNGIEQRIASVALVAGGIHLNYYTLLPEANPVNFAPRMSGPKLILNGRYDDLLPFEVAVRPMFDLWSEPKRLELTESGHTPPPEYGNRIVKEWYDETLGPVVTTAR